MMFALWVSLFGMVARRSDVVSLVRKFHEQPQAPGLVLYLTGGCMQLAPMLLTVPGASRTVLELQVPYSQRSLRLLIDDEPAQYVSADVARQLARQAFLRAQELSGTAAADTEVGGRCLGLGCTAALRSDPPKRGEHRCFLALHSALGVWELELTLNKALNRSRALEDEVVSRCALVALAQQCGLSLLTGGEALDPVDPGSVEARAFWQLPSDDEAVSRKDAALLQDEALLMRFTKH
jgi:hypothetical protein